MVKRLDRFSVGMLKGDAVRALIERIMKVFPRLTDFVRRSQELSYVENALMRHCLKSILPDFESWLDGLRERLIDENRNSQDERKNYKWSGCFS